MNVTSGIDILRQRLFISHDDREQRDIVSEYTIRSKRKKLTNIIILYEKFLPNLLAQDEKNNMLSIMPTEYVNTLLLKYLNESQGDEKTKLKTIIEKIKNKQLHLI